MYESIVSVDLDVETPRPSKSRYDLPVSHHRNTLTRWWPTWRKNTQKSLTPIDSMTLRERRSRQSVYSYWLPSKHRTRNPRKSKFSQMDAKVLMHCIDAKTSYRFTCDVALSALNCALINELKTLLRCYLCKYAKHLKDVMPYNIFSWSAKQFLERRKVKNVVWVDLLRMDIPPACLEMRKFVTDISELTRLFHALLSDRLADRGLRKNSDFKPSIEDAGNYLKLESRLADDLAANTAEMRKLVNSWSSFTLSKKNDPNAQTIVTDVGHKLMEADVFLPILTRYQIGYYGNNANQAEIYCEGKCEKIQKEIQRYKNLSDTESYSTQCSLDSYYTEIQESKNRMQQLSAKYDKDIETIQNQIAYARISIEKLNARKKYLIEQIHRFKSEIEETRQKTREEELDDQRRKQKQQAEEQELVKQAEEEAKLLKKRKNKLK